MEVNDGCILETTILGKIKLVYNNENNKDTFGEEKGCITKIVVVDNDDAIVTINGNKITGDLAYKIRNCEVKEIKAIIS